MNLGGAIFTWGFDAKDARKAPGFIGLFSVMSRYAIDTAIDLRRASAGLTAGAVDPHAAGRLYAAARSGQRILLVCSHPDPAKCHRHAEIALPIAQDAARYAAARALSPDALPIAPILVRHVIDPWQLVDPLALQAEIEERGEKSRKAPRPPPSLVFHAKR